MICTMNATQHVNSAIFPFPGPAPVLSPREIYLRSLEHERDELIAQAYAQKGAPFPSRCSSSSSTEVNPPTPPAHTYNRASYFSAYPPENLDYSQSELARDREMESHRQYDERGRLVDFRESVRQRQERLEFIRRQEFARRLALKGLTDPRMSEYAIRRLGPPQARPAERFNAALKIQRAFRAHLAGKRLLNALSMIASDLDTAQFSFSSSQRRNDGRGWTAAALRRSAVGLRSYGNALSRLRLEFANITRPLRMGKLPKIGHAQSVMARVRALDHVLGEEYEVLERTKVEVGIADMRGKMSKKPWMVTIEEQAEEEAVAEAEMDSEEEDEDYLAYYSESPTESPMSSPATSLSTLSDASLEELDGEHYTIEAQVMEEDDDDVDSEFEISHNEFAAPMMGDDEDEDDVPTLRRTLALSLLYSASSRSKKQGHSRRRHPVILSDFDLHMSKRVLGSQPVSRTPSLGSINEDEE
ncbi:hypothetical protein SCHPADRAFT_993410 [Schizopora paradoxa]|uniref:Uncharacterized protein n=1 Tax=Schizopora paradoxa TaxID=27342 RepID=A0A0H2SNU3_9AGAM|nr:hypothetical protein SCHPADRAFT_993410 [Schizopora paradoxa]